MTDLFYNVENFSLIFYLYQQILYDNPIFLILQEKTQTKPSLYLGVLTLVVSQSLDPAPIPLVQLVIPY
jgi:hypothetical protein